MADVRADVALVVPVFDEELRLNASLEILREFFLDKGLAAHIIIVDDGSRDATRPRAEEWAEKNNEERFSVLVLGIKHRGKGAAVRAGMDFAKAPIVGYCDADLSAGPDAIEEVLRAVEDGVDVAMGSRGLPESVLPIRQPWYRERAGRIFNRLLRVLAGIPYADTQCGLKLFTYEAAVEVFRHQRIDGFAFDSEVVMLAARLGFKIEEVPITWSHAQGSKVSFWRDSFNMSRDVLRIVRRLQRTEIHRPGIPSSDAIDLMVRSQDQHWWHVSKRRLVRHLLTAHGLEGPCLDVGCGGGATVAMVGADVPTFGIDLSPQVLAHASARGLTGLLQAEAAALPVRPKVFGSVLALDTIEHHPRPEQVLREMWDVLRPGGLAIVTVPAYQWMWSHHDLVLGHYRRYTKNELKAELENAGFEIERVSYFHSWLLPVAWVFRKIRLILRRTNQADDFEVPLFLDRILRGLAALELRVLSRRDVPTGLSVVGVARRPSDVEDELVS